MPSCKMITISPHVEAKLQKFLQHIISHSHTYTYFAHILTFFFALPILEKIQILSGMVSIWYDSWC